MGLIACFGGCFLVGFVCWLEGFVLVWLWVFFNAFFLKAESLIFIKIINKKERKKKKKTEKK